MLTACLFEWHADISGRSTTSSTASHAATVEMEPTRRRRAAQLHRHRLKKPLHTTVVRYPAYEEGPSHHYPIAQPSQTVAGGRCAAFNTSKLCGLESPSWEAKVCNLMSSFVGSACRWSLYTSAAYVHRFFASPTTIPRWRMQNLVHGTFFCNGTW